MSPKLFVASKIYIQNRHEALLPHSGDAIFEQSPTEHGEDWILRCQLRLNWKIFVDKIIEIERIKRVHF